MSEIEKLRAWWRSTLFAVQLLETDEAWTQHRQATRALIAECIEQAAREHFDWTDGSERNAAKAIALEALPEDET